MIRAALRDAIYAGQVVFTTPAPREVGGQNEARNYRWRAAKVEELAGSLQREILARATPYDERADHAEGSRLVGRLADTLIEGRVDRAFDEELVRDHAENYARHCGALSMLTEREDFARAVGVEPPPAKSLRERYEGRAARLACPVWWRRQLRRAWTRKAEGGLRDLGIVRRGREPYASDLTVRHRAAQKKRWRDFMERTELVNEAGEQLPLLKVAEASLANPRLRRGEFMCRVRGFEEIAGDLGHVAEFVTLTTPSSFHAQLAGAGANPAFDGSKPRDGQRWLCRQWAKARSKLKRASMLVYGFRIAEPHHDGTPHWHALLFCKAADAALLRFVLRSYFLSAGAPRPVLGKDPEGKDPGCHIERIDSTRGSAVGYVAKYVSKNIDGAGAIGAAEDSETGAPVIDGVARVDAWASVHGVRQFQQIGGPPVGLWRECRRLRDRASDADIERARLCADRGDWRGFVQRVGGIHAGRSTNLRLETVEAGERNRYGECRPARVVGLRWASAVEITRRHCWRLERRGGAEADKGATRTPGRQGRLCSSSPVLSSLGPVAITVRGASSAGETSAWTNPRETSAGP